MELVVVFNTDSNIQTANAHIASGEESRLRYACLELRIAIEKIAYQKLQLRLNKVSVEEVAAWQPKRVIDVLMQLVDERIGADSTLSIAMEDSEGKTQTFSMLGTTKGVSAKELGKNWQKLGSYLHCQMPKKKGDKPIDPDSTELASYLRSVAQYIDDLTSSGFDSHFSLDVTVGCAACEQTIVRNADLLEEGDIVQCQNPDCDTSYIVHRNGEEFAFERYQFVVECKSCDKSMAIEANRLLKMPYQEARNVTCPCGAKHQVNWSLVYGPLTAD